MFKKYFIFLLLLTSLSNAIVGGEPVSNIPDHPGVYNSVALLSRNETGYLRFFCTGSIISNQLILTAKHCVAGKKNHELLIYFGHDTSNIEDSMSREVEQIQSVHSDDWISYFPNLDIAVVKIKGEIPNIHGERKDKPRYRPLEILTDSQLLQTTNLSIVGFGNRNPRLGEIWAGEAHTISSINQELINGPFFQNIILINNKEGQGVCHGDSGGPAYIYHHELKKWMIAGVANGFDLSFTPDSLKSSNDPLFPVVAKCESGQVLYGFAGAYKDWIQNTFRIHLPQSSQAIKLAEIKHQSLKDKSRFMDWCQSLQVAEPGWLTARTLIIKALNKRTDQVSERFVFENCEVANTLINQITEITIDEKDDIDLWEPLASLTSLKTLNVYNRKLNLEEAQVFSQLPQLKKLSLIKVSISDWSWMENFNSSVTHLEILMSQFKHFDLIRNWSNLEVLDLSGNQIETINIPENWNSLKRLNVSNNKISNILIRKSNLSSIEIDVSLNQIHDLSFLNQLHPQQLRILNLNNNPIGKNLKYVSRFNNLKQLYLRKTQVEDISVLKNLKQLELLDISLNSIKKAPEYCPVKSESEEINRVCYNYIFEN